MADEATTSKAVTDNSNDSVATTTIVVGEHSVYNSVEELKEGKRQADEYIAKLSKEYKELQAKYEQLNRDITIANELKQIREGTRKENVTNMENTNPSFDADAVREIALKAMQEDNERQRAESNLASCKEAIASTVDDVELAINNKAKDLGVSVAYLEDIAKTSPKAFKSMFGIKDKPAESVDFLQSTKQVSSNNVGGDAQAFFKSKEAMSNPRAISAFISKALKDPSILNDYNW